MEKHKTDQITIKMLEAKNSMEKAHDFASRAMRKARAKSSLDNIRELGLSRDIASLKATEGEARKSAAVRLARSLAVPRRPVLKAVFCGSCGARLTPGAAFCANCGAKMKTLP